MSHPKSKAIGWNAELWRYLFFLQGIPDSSLTVTQEKHRQFLLNELSQGRGCNAQTKIKSSQYYDTHHPN